MNARDGMNPMYTGNDIIHAEIQKTCYIKYNAVK